jgi:cytochrome oxidase Cu insertion factor (SCO1/SenC/PrrC family)
VRLFALVAALVVLCAASPPPAYIPELQEGNAVPALPLVDQDGRPFSFDELRGQAVIVSFIYTRCGDARMCPLVSAKFAKIQSHIAKDPIHLVELTLDPTFDKPAVLKRYGKAFHQDPARWTLATGSPAWIDELAGRFGIATDAVRPGSIAHTEAAAVIGPDGRITTIVNGNDWTPDEMLAAAQNAVYHKHDLLASTRLWLASAIATCGRATTSMSNAGVLAILAVVLAISGLTFARVFRTSRS